MDEGHECAVCDRSLPSTVFCRDCDERFCLGCSAEIHKVKKFMAHDVSEVETWDTSSADRSGTDCAAKGGASLPADGDSGNGSLGDGSLGNGGVKDSAGKSDLPEGPAASLGNDTGISEIDPLVLAGIVDGISIRRAVPADEAGIRHVFAQGMLSTITRGLRGALFKAWLGGVVFVLLPIALGCWSMMAESIEEGPSGARSGDGATNLSNDDVVMAIRAMYVVVAAGLIGLLGVLWLPGHFARKYVRKSLEEDFIAKKPLRTALTDMHEAENRRLRGDPGKAPLIWVATAPSADKDAREQVVGTVALEAAEPEAAAKAKRRSSSRDSWPGWQEGDAELRRMSVHQALQGRGISKRMFRALYLFASEDICEEEGDHDGSANDSLVHRRDLPQDGEEQYRFQRLVLSTSEMQDVAALYLYPKLGFEVVHTERLLMGMVRVIYFARDLDEEEDEEPAEEAQ